MRANTRGSDVSQRSCVQARKVMPASSEVMWAESEGHACELRGTQRSCMRTQTVMQMNSQVTHANSDGHANEVPGHACELRRLCKWRSCMRSQAMHANSEGHGSGLSQVMQVNSARSSWILADWFPCGGRYAASTGPRGQEDALAEAAS